MTTPTSPTARLSLTEHGRMPNGVVMYWLADGVSLGTDDAELAALIVQAVNAHGDLVKALRKAEVTIRLDGERMKERGMSTLQSAETLVTVQSALAKATGNE